MKLRELQDRAWTFVDAFQRPQRPSKRRRWPLVVAAAVFVAGTVIAGLNLPPTPGEVRWWILVLVAVVGTPAVIAINAAEYQVTARLLGHSVPFSGATRISVLATAANILPVPGAALVRIAGLRGLGAPSRLAIGVTALVGLAWVAITALVGGLLLLVSLPLLGSVVAVAGAALFAVVLLALRSRVEPRDRGVGALGLAAVEVGAVLMSGARLYAVLVGLGHQVELAEVAGLVIAGVIATATGVFPGGLGLREVLAALIAPLVGLSPALGLFATALTRLADYAVLGPISLILSIRRSAEPPHTTLAPEQLENGRLEP